MKADANTKICDECKAGVAISKCGMCNKDVCFTHAKRVVGMAIHYNTLSFQVERPQFKIEDDVKILTTSNKEILCPTCVKNIKNSLSLMTEEETAVLTKTILIELNKFATAKSL